MLSVKMEEIEADGMLRAFDATLRNASAQSVRLARLVRRRGAALMSPAGSVDSGNGLLRYAGSRMTRFRSRPGLVCRRVTHPRQCQCQIRTIGIL
jgi:hypothetical protein